MTASDEWMTQGACVGVNDDTFFPEGYLKADVLEVTRIYCNDCPVRMECLIWALQHEPLDRNGIWGGTTPRERDLLAKLHKAVKQ